MSNVAPYLGFLTVCLMIALSPGPSWVYTISTTLGHGRKYGMISNLGNSAEILCHGCHARPGCRHCSYPPDFFSSGISRRLKNSGKAQKAIRWATGIVSLGFGAQLALADQ